MYSISKDNMTKKRKRTESFEKDSNEKTIKKILKLDKTINGNEEEIYFDTKIISGSESMKILTHNQNINIKTSDFICSFNKNDVLTLIWKKHIEYHMMVEKGKEINNHYISKRGDLWNFRIYFDKYSRNINLMIKVMEKYRGNFFGFFLY